MMNKNDIKRQIAVLLEKIQEQVEKINERENDISQEEMDIMLSDTRELYEKTVVLNYLNSPQTLATPPEEEEKVSIEVETQKEPAPVEEEISDPVSTETSEEDKAMEEVVEEEKPQTDLFAAHPPPPRDEAALADESPTPFPREGESVSADSTEAQHSKSPSNEMVDTTLNEEVIADPDGVIPQIKSELDKQEDLSLGEDLGGAETKQEEQTINEQVALQEDVQSVASKLEREPVADLKVAIGINEKFLFINELFGGSTEEYNDSLNHLNECKDRAEADTYINDNLKEKYHWNEENNAVSVFLDLVERRYL